VVPAHVPPRLPHCWMHVLGCRNANDMFRVLAQFKVLLERPRVQAAVEQFQSHLLSTVRRDIEALQTKFMNSYTGSEACRLSAARDVPPLSGRIIWAHQIERQLERYIRRVKNLLGRAWYQHVDGSRLNDLRSSFRKKLDVNAMSVLCCAGGVMTCSLAYVCTLGHVFYPSTRLQVCGVASVSHHARSFCVLPSVLRRARRVWYALCGSALRRSVCQREQRSETPQVAGFRTTNRQAYHQSDDRCSPRVRGECDHLFVLLFLSSFPPWSVILTASVTCGCPFQCVCHIRYPYAVSAQAALKAFRQTLASVGTEQLSLVAHLHIAIQDIIINSLKHAVSWTVASATDVVGDLSRAVARLQDRVYALAEVRAQLEEHVEALRTCAFKKATLGYEHGFSAALLCVPSATARVFVARHT